MTPDWFKRELVGAIQQFQMNVLLAARASIDAKLATYQVTVAATQEPGAENRNAGRPSATASRALGTARRGQISKFVRERPGSSAHEIARALGMHVGTVRPYLRVLEEDGLLRATLGRPNAPGRPASVYFVPDPSDASQPSDDGRPVAEPSPVEEEAQP